MLAFFVCKWVTVRRDVYTLYTCILWVQKKSPHRCGGKNTHYYICAQAREGIKREDG